MAKTAVLEFLDSPKLISRKICVRENSEISTLCVHSLEIGKNTEKGLNEANGSAFHHLFLN